MKLKLPKLFPSKTRMRLNASAVARRAAVPVDEYNDEPQTKLSSAFIVVLLLHVVAVGGIYAFHSIKARRKTLEPAAVTVAAATGPAPVAPVAYASIPALVAPKLETPAQSPTTTTPTHAAAASLPVGNSRIYHVRAGDTAARVAGQFGVTVAELEELNGSKKLGELHAGQVLNLPKAKATPALVKKTEEPKEVVKAKPTPAIVKKTEEPAKEAPKVAATAKSGAKTYVVAKGDNPMVIARRLGVSYDELLKLNSIEDPKKLQIGAVLKVPAKKAN